MATAVNQDVAKDLKKLSKAWTGSEARTAGMPTPDGDYVAKIIAMTVGKSKKGRLQVQTRYKVMEGKLKGKEFSRFDRIDDEDAMGWFKGYCEVIGVEVPDDLEDLPPTLEDFVNENQDVYDVTLKTKDEFQNTIVKGVSGGQMAGDEPDADDKSKAKKGKAIEIDDVEEGNVITVTDSDGDSATGEVSEVADRYIVITDKDGDEMKFLKKKIESVTAAKKK